MQPPKILVLVLHVDAGRYRQMGDAQRRLWMEAGPLECIHYAGGGCGPPTLEHPHMLRIDASEGNKWDVGPKTVAALAWALDNRDFDFVFRTNSSSYVDQDRLITHAASLPREHCYSGRIDPRYGDFASGSGYAISRDLVAALVQSGCKLDDAPDDVALARWLWLHTGVKPIDAPRIDLQLPRQLVEWRAAGRPANFHYRCRSLAIRRPFWELSCFDEIRRSLEPGGHVPLGNFSQVIA